MDYELDIIPMIKACEGKYLRSVSGRTDLYVESVSENGYRVVCSDDKPFEESHRRAKIIFDKLQKEGVVHADAALENSGSRRNVPETIIANLPFIEHGQKSGRKHLFLRTADTHRLGTLKESE